MQDQPIINTSLGSRTQGAIRLVVPGLILTFGLSILAIAIQRGSGIAGLSPLVVAMVLGMLLRNVVGPIVLVAPGITFSLRRILRFAVILLGFQITFTQVTAVGLTGLAIIVTVLLGTFIFTKNVGRVLGVDVRLSELIAAGTSICGASAVIACNTVTHGSDEDVAYAVACVTVFGSISMLVMPPLGIRLGLAPETYGFWVGTAVHEVAQVVAAAFTRGEIAGQTGTVAKLSRVILLAPMILSLGVLAARRTSDEMSAKAPMPWFVFGFIAIVVVNSVIDLPAAWRGPIVTTTSFLLTVALAAMGFETDVRKLWLKGLSPLLLGAIASLFIASFGLLLIAVFM